MAEPPRAGDGLLIQTGSPGSHAGGESRDLDPGIVAQAGEWVALLWSDEATEADRQACARWRQAHPDHETAFQRMQAFGGALHDIPAPVVFGSLQVSRPNRNGRRKALGVLTAGLVGGGLAYQLRDSGAWLRASSDISTPVGQWRNLRLDDGSLLALNTDTAVDIRFDATQRRIVLRRGEIYLQSHADPKTPARPLLVQTPQGIAQALGTRYSVRLREDSTQVAVYDGAVRVQTLQGDTQVVPAGQATQFSDTSVAMPLVAASDSALAWTRGLIIAEGQRLSDFVTEVARYRPGWLHCAPEVADLLFTGVFRLDDTDFILDALEQGLPVAVRRRSRYWVTVVAA